MSRKKKEYLMANIQVVSFQKRLLKKEDYEALLEESSWAEIRQHLVHYQDSLPLSFPTVEEVDQFYRLELEKLRSNIEMLAVDEDELNLLFVRKNSVAQMIEGHLASATEIDKAILKQYVEIGESSTSERIQQFAKYQIDLYFISRYLREKKPALTWTDEVRGNLSFHDFSLLYGLPKEQGIQWLKKSIYHHAFEEEGTVDQYIMRLEQLQWQLLKNDRYQVRGIEGIFVYVYEQISELYNLRLLLKGKIYRLSPEELKRKMRWLGV